MRLPNGENAVVQIAKLTDYCLSPSHPRGRHKARVFAARLGFTALHTETLQRLVLAAAAERQDADLVGEDSFGTRYVLASKCTAQRGSPRSAAPGSSASKRTSQDSPAATCCDWPLSRP